MTDETAQDALRTAREALRVAQEALRLAERAAGVEPGGGGVWDEITVRKINVVEDDGRLRMLIGNSSVGAVAPARGELLPHPGPRTQAGLLFINDEGTECGGLVFAGRGGEAEGPLQQGCQLSFDDFEQDQGVRLGLAQDGGGSERYLELTDRPSWSLVDLLREYTAAQGEEARAAVLARYAEAPASRLLLSRDGEGNARIVLRDGQGRDRLRFVVPRDGEPVAEVVDVDGATRSLLPPD